jgi:hypothetical protein
VSGFFHILALERRRKKKTMELNTNVVTWNPALMCSARSNTIFVLMPIERKSLL